MVEQAFFASARSGQRDGYQVVAASSAVAEADLRELAVWCPSHDGLQDPSGRTPSINAFPLPSGTQCVSRSFAAAPEYSARGGVHVVTHALILAPDDYQRFAQNPFAVMQAAMAAGYAASELPSDRSLPSFRLVGRARPFDRAAVRQAVSKYSIAQFVVALEACLGPETTILACHKSGTIGVELLTALLACTPVGLRAQLSLASGLVYSPRRAYRWITYHDDATQLRRLERSPDVRVVRMQGPKKCSVEDAPISPPGHAWAACVESCLERKDFLELERLVRQMASVESMAELDHRATDEWSTCGLSVRS